MYSVRSIIAELYLAKWFHPELFKDVDPEAVHRDLVKNFYDIELDGDAYIYPKYDNYFFEAIPFVLGVHCVV